MFLSCHTYIRWDDGGKKRLINSNWDLPIGAKTWYLKVFMRQSQNFNSFSSFPERFESRSRFKFLSWDLIKELADDLSYIFSVFPLHLGDLHYTTSIKSIIFHNQSDVFTDFVSLCLVCSWCECVRTLSNEKRMLKTLTGC